MIQVSYQSLSPIHTDEFPCIGTHTSYHHVGKEPVPDHICVRVGINPDNPLHTHSMIIKLTNTSEHKSKKDTLIQKLKTQYPVSVRFIDLRCYAYETNKDCGYTGYATDFEILEE